MPKLKQPTSLKKITFDVLLECVVRCCDRLSSPEGFTEAGAILGGPRLRQSLRYSPGELIADGSLDELRRGISVIKEKVCSHLPWHLVADFCSRFLENFYHKSRPESHYQSALEIVMDTEIVGLRFGGRIITHFDLENAHRLRSLEALELDKPYENCSFGIADLRLENFCLNDLTTFIFLHHCTDYHLEIIGRSCPKLKVVEVSYSPDVTDEGMLALSPCSELRVVDVVSCPQVSHIGLTHLLSVHAKLEHWSRGHNLGDIMWRHSDTETDLLSDLDWSVQCPSISRFVLENNQVRPTVDLQAIVTKFPNLVYLKINCCVRIRDPAPLRSLHELTGLEINFRKEMSFGFIEQTWDSVKEILTFIGANIKTLKLGCWKLGTFSWNQNDVDFIFESCPNIENLRFDFGSDIVVLPLFQKLKELRPCFRNFRIPSFYDDLSLLFGAMFPHDGYSLETLTLFEFPVDFPLIKSIIFDNVKFPNLSVVETNNMNAEDLAEIEQMARNNNMDFKMNNSRDINEGRATLRPCRKMFRLPNKREAPPRHQ